jgi:hypothetical protein
LGAIEKKINSIKFFKTLFQILKDGIKKFNLKNYKKKTNIEWKIKRPEITRVIFKTNKKFYRKQINKKNRTNL